MSTPVSVDPTALRRALRTVASVAASAVTRSVPALSQAAAQQIGDVVALDLIIAGHVGAAATAKAGAPAAAPAAPSPAAVRPTDLAVDVEGVRLALNQAGALRIDGQPAVAMLESEWEADQRELDQLRRAAATAPASALAPTPADTTLDGADDDALRAVALEVERRRVEDGDRPEHDDVHMEGELAQAAATLAFPPQRRALNGAGIPYTWPFHHSTWRPPVDREKQLVEAGALIVAELARFGRARRRREGTS